MDVAKSGLCAPFSKSLKRKFGAKDEWHKLLKQLQDEGVLTYDESCDKIVVPAPASSPALASDADSENEAVMGGEAHELSQSLAPFSQLSDDDHE